jgi:hypothetical protein
MNGRRNRFGRTLINLPSMNAPGEFAPTRFVPVNKASKREPGAARS